MDKEIIKNKIKGTMVDRDEIRFLGGHRVNLSKKINLIEEIIVSSEM